MNGVAMANVIVIAKSSEFENADYLDVRPILAAAGVDGYHVIELFDVAGLKRSLPQADFILVTSGVFGDEKFVESLQTDLLDEWREAMHGHASVLVLSQLLFAARGLDLPGLDEALAIRPIVRPPWEPKDEGKLAPTSEAIQSQVSWLPESVNYADLNRVALTSSLQGLYWHWWQAKSPELWQTILFDSEQEEIRPLIVQHQKSSAESRIILSAVALDRIRDQQLLVNLIRLCVGGEFSIGYLVKDIDSMESGLMVSSIRGHGERVKTYQVEKSGDLTVLREALSHGLHQSLVVARDVPKSYISEISAMVSGRVSSGSLQIVWMEDFSELDHTLTLKVSAVDNSAQFQDLVASAFWRLSSGLIGQSIFDTAHVMNAILQAEPDALQNQDWSALTKELIERLRPDGIFEGPPVPVAAFIYVASVILGHTSNRELETSRSRSVQWLVEVFDSESTSNQLRIALYLARAEAMPTELRMALERQLKDLKVLDMPIQAQRRYLDLLIHYGDEERVIPLVGAILSKSDDDPTEHSTGIGELLVSLLGARHLLLSRMQSSGGSPEALIDSLNRRVTILGEQVLTELVDSTNKESFPTRVRLAASFERYMRSIAVPTSPLVKILSGSQASAVASQRWAEATDFVAKASNAVKASRDREVKLVRGLRRLRFERRFSRLAIFLLALLGAMSSLLLFFSVEPNFAMLSIAWNKFTENWGFVSGFVAFLIPFATWAFFAFRAGQKNSLEDELP